MTSPRPSTTAAIREVLVSNPGQFFTLNQIEDRAYALNGESMNTGTVASRIRTLRTKGLNVLTRRDGRNVTYGIGA